MKIERFIAAAVLLLPLLLPFPARADDLADRARAAWDRRDDPARAGEAVKLYQELAARDESDVEARIMLARATYWRIEADEVLAAVTDSPRLSSDEQAALAEQGAKACYEVMAKNEEEPRAHYWLVWDMAARTLARGLFSGFAFKEAIVATIMVSKADYTYQYGGIYRYWARVIHEMPGLLGRFFHFNEDDAAWLYQKAIAVEPRYLRNHFWLAESYEKLERPDDAKNEYLFIVSQPDDALPEVAPENRLYQRWALKRLEKM